MTSHDAGKRRLVDDMLEQVFWQRERLVIGTRAPGRWRGDRGYTIALVQMNDDLHCLRHGAQYDFAPVFDVRSY